LRGRAQGFRKAATTTTSLGHFSTLRVLARLMLVEPV
jgi:hypothetical protein